QTRSKETRRAAKPEHRIRFSELPFARRSNRFREPRTAAFLSRREQERPAVDRLRYARSFSDGRQERSLPNPAFIWPATTRRHCSCSGCESANHPCRRTDWKSSFGARQGNHGHVQTVK